MARRSNQSILKEISPEYPLEGLMLKLKLQYFGHLMQRADSLEKTLMLGKIEGRRKRGWQRIRWLDGIINSVDMNLGKVWEIVKDREAWPAIVHGVVKSQTWLSNWTTTIISRENRQLVLKRLLDGFQGRVFKRQCEGNGLRVPDQLMHNSLIDRWWGPRVVFQKSQLSTFWFHLARGLHAGGQQAIKFFYLVGVLISTNIK